MEIFYEVVKHSKKIFGMCIVEGKNIKWQNFHQLAASLRSPAEPIISLHCYSACSKLVLYCVEHAVLLVNGKSHSIVKSNWEMKVLSHDFSFFFGRKVFAIFGVNTWVKLNDQNFNNMCSWRRRWWNKFVSVYHTRIEKSTSIKSLTV